MNRQRRSSSRPPQKGNNTLRIIGGEWRGRKLPFPSLPGLRPTPDRVRETLFNWLAAVVPGARCLDLFAGSGALGLEALSRGASSATWIDSSRLAADTLKNNLKTLQADGNVVQASALDWLQQAPNTDFDIVFLDPPFGQGLVAQILALIESSSILASEAWVYIEMAQDEPLPEVPANWTLYRNKQAGQVSYRLFRVDKQ